MRMRRMLVCILGALAVGCYLLWPSILRLIAQETLRSAQRSGARISWEGLTASGFSLSFESFVVWLPGPEIKRGIRPPIKIDLQRTRVRVSPWSLLLLNPLVDFQLDAYGGSIEGTATDVRTSPRLSATLRDVDLAKHDQVRPLGIASALVSGTLSDFQQIGESGAKGTFDIVVRRIDIPRIPQALSLVKLPPLSEGEIHVRGSLDPDKVELEQVKVTSSYGSADGAGRAMNLSRQGSQSADGELRVSIGEELHAQISPLLPVLSNNVLQASTHKFKARMRGFPCSRGPRAFGDLELGGLCVRFTPEGLL